ncbi:YfdX family protein [Sulfurovum riftiae]|uniref:YfdX protein n=1 Tax=Sulfurovum riftiae TaxID=1630136 RepID=A0A151CE69_9BACT|nr:YfdX family protein [Sulfurovum riftiae]KYJ85787.1 hypothetical protein AS592_03340 [Sulfurovum riftiae]
MKKRLLLSALTCGVLLGTTGLQAQTDKKELVQNVMQKEVKDHKQAPKEIVAGMQNTFAALKAMQANKKDEAKKALEAATKSFDAALKADPSLDIIPIDERFQAYAFMGSSDVIEARLKLAQQLLKAHDTQTAIAILTPLKDELDITVISIPMKIYPVATKKALDELNKGDDKAAFAAIAEAMNSLVIASAIVPTPLLVAQDLIMEASKLDKEKKEDAKKLLAAAKEELKRAELLGYVSRNEADYKLLNEDIEKIEKEIKGKNAVVKLYETLKNDFKKIIDNTKISKMTPQEIAEKKVNDFEKEEGQKAVKEKDEFKQEAQQDEKKTVK